MTGISLRAEFKPTLKGLNRLSKKQVPFATALALTQLAKAGQTKLRRHTDRVFDLKAKAFTLRGIKIKPAKKRQVAKGLGFSEVYTSDKITNYMVSHEEGETRKAQKGKLAVPSFDIKNKNYRKASGGVKKKFLPATLLKDYRGQRGTQKPRIKTARKRPFIIRGKGDTTLIVKRTSKKRKPLKILFAFSKKAKIPKTWDARKTVNVLVKSIAKRTMERSLSRAIRSAR